MIAPERWYEYQEKSEIRAGYEAAAGAGEEKPQKAKNEKSGFAVGEREKSSIFAGAGSRDSHDNADNNNGILGYAEI